MTIEELIDDFPLFKESRLNSLYSAFQKNKQLNPEGYEANIRAWKSLFNKIIATDALNQDSILSITTYQPNLAELLALPKYGTPKNLDNILQEFIDTGFLIPNSLYTNARENYQTTVSGHFGILGVLNWNNWLQWRALKGFKVSDSGKLKNERYIHWDQLVNIGKQVARLISEKIVDNDPFLGDLLTLEMLREKLEQVIKNDKLGKPFHSLSLLDLKILLIYWERECDQCNSININNNTFIKWSPEKMSNEEISIINIKSTMLNLEKRQHELEDRIGKIDYKCVLKLDVELRKSKLSQLMQKKKFLLKALSTANSQVMEVQGILHKLENARFNLDYVSTLKESSLVIQKYNKQVVLEDVEKIREDLDEEMEKIEEVSDVLAGRKPIVVDDVDDDELELELNQLQNEFENDIKNKQTEKKENSVTDSNRVSIDNSNLVKIGDAHNNESMMKAAAAVDEKRKDNESLGKEQEALVEKLTNMNIEENGTNPSLSENTKQTEQAEQTEQREQAEPLLI